ncbi:nitroreductase family protein [Nocardioides sp. SYSU D00038]|uniref:nitroreductase family protein n=1 Tax=Nocardioides sp. SYSU D00038 TaxID=2812554 RepID=UPI001967E11A|nr:nitroreductase family protein [Nocardioides sp. SYSU D00038]
MAEIPHRRGAPMPGAEVLAEPLRSRWSPSVFDPAHVVGREQVVALIRAAQWAPSCGNAQPWHLVVAERGDATHDLLVARLSRGNAGWVPRASLVLVVGAQVAPDDRGEGGTKPAHAEYDAGQAAAHVTLQARAMGLHAHQFAGFDRTGLAADLGAPPWVRLLAGIAVGVPGDLDDVPERDREREHRVRRRRPAEQWVHAGSWGTPWPGLEP